MTYLNEPNYAMLVRATDLKSNFNSKEFVYITQQAYEFLHRVNIDEDSIILPNIGANIGESYFCNKSSLPYKYNVLGPNTILIRSKTNNNKFLYYMTQTKQFKNKINEVTAGSGVPKFNKTDLKKIKVQIPVDYSYQEKIATLLSSIDDLIETSKKLLDENEKLITACYQQIIKNEKKWKVYKIGDIFQVTRGSVLSKDKLNLKGAKYPVYSSQTTDNGLLGHFPEYLYEDAITWTTDGANAGDVNYRQGKFYCTNVCGVLLNNEYANTFNAFHLNRKTRNYVSYVGNPKLMNNVMENIYISFPTTDKSKKYSILLDDLNLLTNLYKNEIESYVTFKKYYLNIIFK